MKNLNFNNSKSNHQKYVTLLFCKTIAQWENLSYSHGSYVHVEIVICNMYICTHNQTSSEDILYTSENTVESVQFVSWLSVDNVLW